MSGALRLLHRLRYGKQQTPPRRGLLFQIGIALSVSSLEVTNVLDVPRLSGEVGGQIGDILVAQGRGETRHDRVLAFTRFVVVQGLCEVGCVLPGKLRVAAVDGRVAISTVTGLAGGGFGLAGFDIAIRRGAERSDAGQ